MKKLFVVAALVMGVGTTVSFVSAAVQANEDGTNTYKVTVADQEGVQSEVFFSEKGEILQ